MNETLKRYLKISLINLLLIASIGVVLRYKILYSLPFVDQKNLLHGHSHFAFAGWISQTLMVLLTAYLSSQTGKDEIIRYKKLLLANLLTAYGMLIAFPIQGYGLISILFSTLSVITFYFFAYSFWKDLNKLPFVTVIHYWFKSALLLGALSSIGTFGLAFMMATKIINQNLYLASVYFYLHFQYNGWFFFVCMGLMHKILPKEMLSSGKLLYVFWLFAFASIPGYFLSTLWMKLPVWIFLMVIIASFAQVIAWIIFIRYIFQNRQKISTTLNKTGKVLILLSALALTTKLFLQLGSTIPSLSQLAFGFRSIVIAYLHLVLLGVITLFLLGYIFSSTPLSIKRKTTYGLILFTSGIFLNEVVLMIQGVASFSYTLIPFTNELLFAMALIMFTGIAIIVASQHSESE